MFPEKWSVYSGENTFPLQNLINELYKELGISSKYHGNSTYVYYNFDGESISSFTGDPRYSEVTIEQLKEHYLNQSKKEEMSENRKIIGYKTPMNLFGGLVLKDTLYKDGGSLGFYPERTTKLTDTFVSLPKEIVETWEPVYNEEFKAGDWVYVVSNTIDTLARPNYEIGEVFQIVKTQNSEIEEYRGWAMKEEGKEICFAGIRRATPEEIERANHVKVGDYIFVEEARTGSSSITGREAKGQVLKVVKVDISYVVTDFINSMGDKCGGIWNDEFRKATEEEIKASQTIIINEYPLVIDSSEKVSFGCQSFTKEEIVAYRNLLKRSVVGAEIKIHGETITPNILNRILSKMNSYENS